MIGPAIFQSHLNQAQVAQVSADTARHVDEAFCSLGQAGELATHRGIRNPYVEPAGSDSSCGVSQADHRSGDPPGWRTR